MILVVNVAEADGCLWGEVIVNTSKTKNAGYHFETTNFEGISGCP
jgi:hypothetical protein